MNKHLAYFLEHGRISVSIFFDGWASLFSFDLNIWCVGLAVHRDFKTVTLYLLCLVITIVWGIEEI